MKKISIVLLMTLAIGFLGGCSDDVGGGGESSSSKIAAPIGLKASAKSSTSIKLTWASVDDASYYNIEYDDGYGWTSEGAAAYYNEYTVSGLQPYTNYSFRVRAVGRSNTSEWSSTKSARTWIGKPLVLPVKSSSTTVTLFIALVEGASSYGVYYGTTPDYTLSQYYDTVRPENGSVPDVKISKLTAGKTYYFFVMPMSSGTSQAEYAIVSVSL